MALFGNSAFSRRPALTGLDRSCHPVTLAPKTSRLVPIHPCQRTPVRRPAGTTSKSLRRDLLAGRVQTFRTLTLLWRIVKSFLKKLARKPETPASKNGGNQPARGCGLRGASCELRAALANQASGKWHSTSRMRESSFQL